MGLNGNRLPLQWMYWIRAQLVCSAWDKIFDTKHTVRDQSSKHTMIAEFLWFFFYRCFLRTALFCSSIHPKIFWLLLKVTFSVGLYLHFKGKKGSILNIRWGHFCNLFNTENLQTLVKFWWVRGSWHSDSVEIINHLKFSCYVLTFTQDTIKQTFTYN